MTLCLKFLVSCCGLVVGQDAFLAAQQPQPSAHNLTFSLHRETTFEHPLGYTIHKSTYLTDKVSLAPGEMVFTRIHDTIITMPEGRYAIVNFRGEVVDEDEKSVPLDKVFNHHWIVRTLKVKPHVNQLCGGGMNFNFGIGAESRIRPTELPAGYGFVVEDGEVWGANLHLLHIENLAGPAKECAECWWGPNKGPKCSVAKNGTFDCCGELCSVGECTCTTASGAPTRKTDYFLKYDVYWTSEVDKITPVDLDILSTPNCAIEYDVLRNNKHPERLDSYSFKMPVDTKIVLAQGHLHTGGLNISMYVNDQFFCASVAKYGSQVGVAGDELGHLIDVSPCFQDAAGLSLSKGDVVRLDGWYYVGDDDLRVLPGEGGTHLGVMAYMEFAHVTSGGGPDIAKCQKQLLADGCALASGTPCLKCGQTHQSDLLEASCTETIVRSLCAPALH